MVSVGGGSEQLFQSGLKRGVFGEGACGASGALVCFALRSAGLTLPDTAPAKLQTFPQARTACLRASGHEWLPPLFAPFQC